MLDKPDIQDALIVAALRDAFGLDIAQVVFLPLGADFDTAVYKVVAADGTPYFLKLRRGNFLEIAVAIPRFLQTQGIAAVMAPIPATGGQLWTGLGGFKLILYPFVEGHNGIDVELSDRQWRDLGATLKAVHASRLPPDRARCTPRETYSPRWRGMLRAALARSQDLAYDDPAAARLAALLKAERAEIERIVGRAERLAVPLRRHPRKFVLCHTDIHAANVLLGADDSLFIVDWDNPLLAPPERDLMFMDDGSEEGMWRNPREELFYQGYGQAEIDPVALAYYQSERVVEDIAVTCEMVFSGAAAGDPRVSDREQAVQYVVGRFPPDDGVEIAHRMEE
jgi:spectinomycin phosphotransferase